MSEENYYIVLSVAENATTDEIKSAYRSLLKKIHPDTVSTLSEETQRRAEEATREINEAYAVLSDPGQRAEYGYYLAEQRRARTANPDTSISQSQSNPQNSDGTLPANVQLSHKKRRRRKRHRRHSSKRDSIKSLFRPVSAADWVVLFCYIFVAIGVLAFLAVMISSASDSESEDTSLLLLRAETAMLTSMNGAGYGDRTRDIELGKLAFYR